MRLIAFYLPQFHEIPENNSWWGHGFTEWVNVRRARPQFDGHDHPRAPDDSIGEYNLTNPDALRTQSALARAHGIDAFCMYFYWFDGMRLLERPTDAWREDHTLLPYCLSWANEAWTRRWDGRNKDVLMPQSYPEGYVRNVFEALAPHFRAPHYVSMDEKPVLVVHRADLIPHPRHFASEIRALAREAGFPGIYLVATETIAGTDPRIYAFDAVAEFPPVTANRLRNALKRPPRNLNSSFRGRLLSYEHIQKHYLDRAPETFIRHRGVMPAWDNTARRGHSATVYVGAAPSSYENWIKEALRLEAAEHGDNGIVFVNAWNEWAEGAYLEPDVTHGLSYLRATRRAKDGSPSPGSEVPHVLPQGRVSIPFGLSLIRLAAGSALATIRTFRNARRARAISR